MNSIIIIAARMTSSRFPGKAVALFNGKPILQHVIERCHAANVAEVLVAIPQGDQQQPIRDLAALCGVAVHAGDEHDVLHRVIEAAEIREADDVLRVNADCPLIDPEDVAVLAGVPTPSLSRYYFGFRDVESGRAAVLTKAGKPERVALQSLRDVRQFAAAAREHVTWGVYQRMPPTPCRWLDFRWDGVPKTIDTEDDLKALETWQKTPSPSVLV